MNEYAFGLNLHAIVRVKAESEAAAHKLVTEYFDAIDCDAGIWPNGDPISFEASVDGELNLLEVNEEPAP